MGQDYGKSRYQGKFLEVGGGGGGVSDSMP